MVKGKSGVEEHIFARQERGTANSRCGCYFYASVPFSFIQLKHHIPFIERTRALIREDAAYKMKTFASFFFLTLTALSLFILPHFHTRTTSHSFS